MPYNPLDEFPTLKLPIKGKTYVVKAPDAATGLWVQSIMVAASAIRAGQEPAESDLSTVLDDDDERDLHRRVLGDTFDELVADKIPWPALKKAGATTVMWITYGDDVAERFWNGATDDPKAPAPVTASSETEVPPV